MSLDARLLADLAAIGAAAGGGAAGGAPPGGPPTVLSDRPDGVVVRVGDVVVKAHPAGTGRAALAQKLAVAASPALGDVLLPPLPIPVAGAAGDRLIATAGGRLVTAWPAGEALRPDEVDAAPWEQAARLLATLHQPARAESARAVCGRALPPGGGPVRVARALARLGSGGGTADRLVRAAAERLPPGARGAAPAAAGPSGQTGLVHGDWHLGQVVRVPSRPGAGADHWRLIDVDDLGVGDPAWDLARPAAWFAVGLLSPAVWERFLATYRATGGGAVPRGGDPWGALDLPARALTVQSAAIAVAAARRDGRPLDEVDIALVDACRRIARLGGRP